MKIALIDKQPSKNDYKKYFKFDFDTYHMSSVPLTKLLKKDVDLVVDLSGYDFVILVGSEAAKEYAKVTSITNMAGHLVANKFMCISNPAMLHFKPEAKVGFDRALDRIHRFVEGGILATNSEGKYLGISNERDALKYLQEVYDNAQGVVAMDTETSSLYPRKGYVLGMSLSWTDHQGAYIDTLCLDDGCIKLLEQIIDKYDIVFHNMKFDIKMIEFHLGIKFNRLRVHDTMLMHYALDENEGHGLKDLALKHTDYGDYDAELDEYRKEYCKKHGILQDDFSYDLFPFDVISRYAAIDTACTMTLYKKFWPALQKNSKVLGAYKMLLLPGTLFLLDMEEAGIPIDKDRMLLAEEYLDREIAEASEKVYAFKEVQQYEKDTDSKFNPNSVVQLRKILFDYIGLESTGKLTATGALSTDAEVLEELANQHPFPAQLLKVRQLTKIKNTYISKILPALDKDSRIRTSFNLHFTTSGRLSSSGTFNAQQIPRDNSIVKACIKAPEGYKIISQD